MAARRKPQLWLIAAGLALATLLAYQPAWHGTWLWDDAQHITQPAARGLTLSQIWFEIGATQQYYPIVHSIFWLEHRLWGDDAFGYHVLNILLHATSAGLLLLILRRLAVPGAVLAAFIFALHPVHVESVAWITELKNTMSGVFYLAAMLVYLRFDETRSTRAYAGALALFACALLSKTVTATLPAGVLVILWWRRGRLDWTRDVAPLAAFVTLGVAAGLVTSWVEHHVIGAQGSEFNFTFIERCLIAGRAAWFYLATIVWPANLTFIYPRWAISQTVWWLYLFPIAMAGVLTVLWMLRDRSRAPLAALLFFGVTAGPALGFVNVYPFKFSFVADHFQYLATIPIIVLISAGITLLLRGAPARVLRLAVPSVVVVTLWCLTWQQSHDYVSATTLYRATLERNPAATLAHVNLAAELMNGSLSDVREGVSHARAALALEPTDIESRYNLAGGLRRLGDLDAALAQYRIVLDDVSVRPAERPRMAGLYRSLGSILHDLGRAEEAISSYEASLRIEPGSAGTHTDLGIVLSRSGRYADGLVHFAEAARLEPAVADRHTNLGGVLLQSGQFDAAIAEYRRAVTLAPGSPDVYTDLAVALLAAGRPAEAAAVRETARNLLKAR